MLRAWVYVYIKLKTQGWLFCFSREPATSNNIRAVVVDVKQHGSDIPVFNFLFFLFLHFVFNSQKFHNQEIDIFSFFYTLVIRLFNPTINFNKIIPPQICKKIQIVDEWREEKKSDEKRDMFLKSDWLGRRIREATGHTTSNMKIHWIIEQT